jgi:hypothetical protein
MLDMEMVITQMKNNKSPGYNYISVDMITAVRSAGMQRVYSVLTKIWIENRIPDDCYKGIIMPVYRKEGNKLWKLQINYIVMPNTQNP